MRGPAKLFIATPTADGIMLAGYVAALAALLTRLHETGIATAYQTLDGRDLVGQRNRLVHAFLASDCTHLLFIDSDMSFAPDLAERLLAADKAVIGTIYPQRRIDFGRIRDLMDSMPFERALALAYSWNARLIDEEITVTKGLARVEGIGGGFLLIRRDCFATLATRDEAPVCGEPDAPTGLRAFFRETRSGEDVIDLDYSFCRAWIACGGEVWAYVPADIRHIGDHRHGPPFRAYLEAQAQAPRRSPPAKAVPPRRSS